MAKPLKRIRLRPEQDRSPPPAEKKPIGVVCTCVGFKGVCCKLRRLNETQFDEEE